MTPPADLEIPITISDARVTLMHEMPANVLCVLLGTVGVFSCATLIFVYATFDDFRSKCYAFLSCSAGANLSVCFGMMAVAVLRLTQLLTGVDPSINASACLLLHWPSTFGNVAVVGLDFVVVVDRLLAVHRPQFYRRHLGVKYVLAALTVAFLPALVTSLPPLFTVRHLTCPLCSLYSENCENDFHTWSDFYNEFMLVVTLLLYGALILTSWHLIVVRAVLPIWSTDSPSKLGQIASSCVRQHQRVVRQAAVTVLVNSVTCGLSFTTRLAMQVSNISRDRVSTISPYTSLLMVVNAVLLIFVASFADRVLRRRVLTMLSVRYCLFGVDKVASEPGNSCEVSVVSDVHF